MVHSGSMSPTHPRVCEKFLQSWWFKTSLTGASVRPLSPHPQSSRSADTLSCCSVHKHNSQERFSHQLLVAWKQASYSLGRNKNRDSSTQPGAHEYPHTSPAPLDLCDFRKIEASPYINDIICINTSNIIKYQRF